MGGSGELQEISTILPFLTISIRNPRSTGGLERMIQIWEASRDTKAGGYGGSVLEHVSTLGQTRVRSIRRRARRSRRHVSA